MAQNDTSFTGFPKDLPDFLWGLSLNNERPWFQAHREDFERCLHQPILALAEEVSTALETRHPGIAPRVHVSRIWRDARRLFGHGPFQNHMWFSLGVSGDIYTTMPQFWFGIDATCWEAGMGCWNMNGTQLERWRKSIDINPRPLKKIVRDLQAHPELTPLWKEYKRPKGDPGKELFSWYNAMSVELGRTVPFDPDPPGPDLPGQVLAIYEALTPLYLYLQTI